MDASQRSSKSLTERAANDVSQLLQRFENIIALAPIADHECNTGAIEAYQMQVETAALVRAAEDILSLTRSLKEAWLFGQLNTIGENQAEAKTEEYAKVVIEGLERLIEDGQIDGTAEQSD